METIPYIAYESALARAERTIRRVWILCILLVILLVCTNGAWLWYESQFTDSVTTTTSVESSTSDGGNAMGIIGDGNEVNYGESESN